MNGQDHVTLERCEGGIWMGGRAVHAFFNCCGIGAVGTTWSDAIELREWLHPSGVTVYLM